jgi:hypothetical protein
MRKANDSNRQFTDNVENVWKSSVEKSFSVSDFAAVRNREKVCSHSKQCVLSCDNFSQALTSSGHLLPNRSHLVSFSTPLSHFGEKERYFSTAPEEVQQLINRELRVQIHFFTVPTATTILVQKYSLVKRSSFSGS